MPPPPRPFRSDGCTFWPDGRWRDCCVEHDRAYWRGGSAAARRAADRALHRCVTARGHPWVAAWMYWGVRLGGVPWLPTAWRWGFGWPWRQRPGYVPDDAEETA